jgi:hypothetical protein
MDMKNIINKKYILKRIAADGESTMYFRSRLDKGMFHYVFRIEEATRLTKKEATKLLNEIKHKERFEIMEVKNGK